MILDRIHTRAMLFHTDEVEVHSLDLARECPRCGRTLLGDRACRCRAEVPVEKGEVKCMHGRLFGWFGCPRCGRRMLLGASDRWPW